MIFRIGFPTDPCEPHRQGFVEVEPSKIHEVRVRVDGTLVSSGSPNRCLSDDGEENHRRAMTWHDYRRKDRRHFSYRSLEYNVRPIGNSDPELIDGPKLRYSGASASLSLLLALSQQPSSAPQSRRLVLISTEWEEAGNKVIICPVSDEDEKEVESLYRKWQQAKQSNAVALLLHKNDAEALSQAYCIDCVDIEHWEAAAGFQLISLGPNSIAVVCDKLGLPNVFNQDVAHLARVHGMASGLVERQVDTLTAVDLETYIKSLAGESRLNYYEPRTFLREGKLGKLPEVLGEPCAVISGVSALGKTTALRYVLFSLASELEPALVREAEPEALQRALPVLVPLNRYGTADLHGLILSQLSFRGVDVPRAGLEGLLKTGVFVLLLDGLNEVEPSLHRQCVTEILEMRARCPKNQYIVTTRPETYAGDLEFPVFTLQAFDENNVRSYFLEILGEKDGHHLYISLDRKVKDLAKVPLLAHLIATYYRSKGKIPKNRTVLYSSFIRELLEVHEGRIGKGGAVSPGLKEELLGRLALATFSAGKISFSERLALDIFVDYLMREEIKVRYGDVRNASAILSELFTNGILTKQEYHGEFLHQSYQEYFCAREIQRRRYEDLDREKICDVRWKEVMRFSIELPENSVEAQPVIDAVAEKMSFMDEDYNLYQDSWNLLKDIDEEYISIVAKHMESPDRGKSLGAIQTLYFSNSIEALQPIVNYLRRGIKERTENPWCIENAARYEEELHKAYHLIAALGSLRFLEGIEFIEEFMDRVDVIFKAEALRALQRIYQRHGMTEEVERLKVHRDEWTEEFKRDILDYLDPDILMAMRMVPGEGNIFTNGDIRGHAISAIGFTCPSDEFFYEYLLKVLQYRKAHLTERHRAAAALGSFKPLVDDRLVEVLESVLQEEKGGEKNLLLKRAAVITLSSVVPPQEAISRLKGLHQETNPWVRGVADEVGKLLRRKTIGYLELLGKKAREVLAGDSPSYGAIAEIAANISNALDGQDNQLCGAIGELDWQSEITSNNRKVLLSFARDSRIAESLKVKIEEYSGPMVLLIIDIAKTRVQQGVA